MAPRARGAWREFEALRAQGLPSASGLESWKLRVTTLFEALNDVKKGGPREQVFAAIVAAHVLEHLVRLRYGTLTKDLVRGDATMRGMTTDVRDYYRQCIKAVAASPAAMRGWEERCTQRERELTGLLARAGGLLRWPRECEKSIRADPTAPPPSRGAKAELAVIYAGEVHRFGWVTDMQFGGPDPREELSAAKREKLLHAAAKYLSRRTQLPLVPRAEIRAAELLVEQKRWHKSGPTCGQPPPLPALLAARHENLVVASLRPVCSDAAGPVQCELWVDFYRPGSPPDGQDVPRHLWAPFAGPADSVADWSAVMEHSTDNRQHLGVLAVQAKDSNSVVAAADENDPWLRTQSTLQQESLARCHEGTPASFAVSVTVTPDGRSTDVVVDPGRTPPHRDAEKISACIADVVREAAWPCPRSGKPTPVRATICVGTR